MPQPDTTERSKKPTLPDYGTLGPPRTRKRKSVTPPPETPPTETPRPTETP